MVATGDTGFGPRFAALFDFTLTFEHIVLNIVPTTLLVAISPLLLFYYIQRPDVILPGRLLWAKLICSSLLIGVELVTVALCKVSDTLLSDNVSVAAASLSFCASVCTTIIVYLEHRRALRSSAIVAMWLILAICCDIVRARSYFLRENMNDVASLTVVTAVLRACLVALEEIPKNADIKDQQLRKSIGKEATSGFLSRSLFLWLNRVLFFGFQNRLEMDHLDNLDPCFSSVTLSENFAASYPNVPQLSYIGFTIALFRNLWIEFLKIIFPRLCYIIFSFAQPLFLHAIVRFIERKESSAVQKAALVVAAALIYMGIAVSRASFTHHSFRLVTQIRGVLTTLILQKTLRIDHSEAQQAAAVTLMSTDVDGITSDLSELHNIWANLIEIAVGVYLLARVVGRAAFVAVFPALLSAVAAAYLGKKMPDSRKIWIESTERRVASTSTMLSQIKALKTIGLEEIAGEKIQFLRKVEIEQSKRFRIWTVILVTTSVFCDSIPGPIILAAGLFWTTFSGRLTTLDAFTTLALVQLMADPLAHFLSSYTTIASAQACLRRIFNFLCLGEQRDSRQQVPRRHGDTAELVEKGRPDGDRGMPPANGKQRAHGEVNVVEFRNATISAQGADEPILRGVNLSIERNKLVMVTGPTGCGKSALLRAILGEIPATEGSLYVEPSTAAYCDQDVWLCNGTVRDNIVADSPWDEPWYNTVLDACLLRQDLRQLSSGDLTNIGSKGSGLSGGQKARVAIARAIYARGGILIMDDIFRSIDRKTARQIFVRLFGPDGLLKQSPATVIIATHSIQLLHAAEQIVVLDAKRNISVETSLTEALVEKIRATAIAVNKALGRPDDYQEEDDEDSDKDIDNEDDSEDGDQIGGEEVSAAEKVNEQDDEQDDEQDNEKQGSTDGAKVAATVTDKANNEARQEKRVGDLKLYAYYLKFFGRVTMMLWVFDVFLVTFTETFPIAYIRIWLDINPESNLFFVGYVVLSLSAGVFTAIDLGLWFLRLVPESNLRMHELVLRTTMCATLCFLTMTDHGSLLNHFSQDMQLVSLNLPLSLLRTIYAFSTILMKTGIILSGTQYTALLLPVLCLIVYFVQYYYLRTSRQMRHLDLEAKAPLYTQFSEIAAGLRHIRAFGWQAKRMERSLELLDSSQKPFYYMFTVQRWLTLVMDSTTFVTAVVLVTIAVCVQSATSPTGVALSLVGLISFSSSLSAVVQDWTTLETSVAALERLDYFSKTTPTEKDPKNPIRLPKDWPDRGEVSIKNVTAKYSPDEESPVVLDNLTTHISPGQKVGIVGRTGSGKSSIIMTLLKFTEFVGDIYIDGINVRRIPHRKLRARITTISQDPIELDDTVKFNVCPWTMSVNPGREGNPEDIVIGEVLRRLKLWDYIRVRGGLNARLRDLRLSHGQLQLLGIARGLLHKLCFGSNLVLMDEPTSGLDPDLEKVVQQVFRESLSDCTIIMIAHRVESLRDTDFILHMEDSKLVDKTIPRPPTPEPPGQARLYDGSEDGSSSDSDEDFLSRPVPQLPYTGRSFMDSHYPPPCVFRPER